MAEILSPTPENLARAAAALRAGEVVGMPTETVYGLAGNALDERAVSKIFATKERPTFDPLIVHVAPERPGFEELVNLQALPAQARARAELLMQAFWPGPLTLVLPKGPRVPDLVTSGLPRVAVRMPRHPVAQALLRASGLPLAAPSANRFGRISPTSAADVQSELGDRISLILDGGPCELGVESTVLALEGERALLLRPGGVPREVLSNALGMEVELVRGEGPSASPGTLESHYAPRKPMRMLEGPLASARFPSALPKVIGVLAQSGEAAQLARELGQRTGAQVRVEVLSPRGDSAEGARRLFAAMRALDASDAEALFAEPCASDEGLAHAIADRLRRACARG